MGRILDRLIGPPLAAVAPPSRVAAAARVTLAPTSNLVTGWGIGGELLAPINFPTGDALGMWDRSTAMSIPTISRARDLICSAVGALPLTIWNVDFATNPAEPIEERIPPPSWMARPDPNRTRQWILAWTTDDLFFYSVAYWRIASRFSDRYPATFERMPAVEVNVSDDGIVTWQNEQYRKRFDTTEVDPADVIEFLSPIEGILSNGWRAIAIAVALDTAAERFAGAEVPAGILEEQDGGEDLSADELAVMAADFTLARRTNTTAATNKYVRYRESTADPNRMQLIQSRVHQALELARLSNVPPYLVGAPSGTGMTYQNAVQARGDLIDFGALPYVGCIEQTLGGPNVVPRGRAVRLDVNAWLRNPLTGTNEPSPNDLEQAFNTPAPDPVMDAGKADA